MSEKQKIRACEYCGHIGSDVRYKREALSFLCDKHFDDPQAITTSFCHTPRNRFGQYRFGDWYEPYRFNKNQIQKEVKP
jgi:hypothetical protein